MSKALTRFFALTFALSWSRWILAVFSDTLRPFAMIAGTFGPAAAALILLRRRQIARRALIARLFDWRLSAVTYAYALGLPVFGIVCALIAARLVTGSGAVLPAQMPVYVPFLVFAYVLFLSVLGEELGWRGYALPDLLGRHGPVAASLILGTVWAIWHAPLFFMPGGFHAGIPPLLFFIQVVASSVIYTHLHILAAGSLVPAHLFHAVFNAAVGFFPILPAARGGDATALWIAVAFLTAVAVVIARGLARMPKLKGP